MKAPGGGFSRFALIFFCFFNFPKLGADMLDCDKLGHLAYAVGTPGHAQVMAAFGPQVVAADGSIDRKALGAVVFSDAVKVRRGLGSGWRIDRRVFL